MTKRRITNNLHFYHVTMHGHNTMAIFETHQDRFVFLRVLEKVNLKYPFTILAYCIMPNHYHLLIKSDLHSLSLIMGSINLRYSLYYKQMHGHKGTLYDQRFHSNPVLGSRNLINTSIYIHCNPIHSKKPLSPSAETYLFSSYRYYSNINLKAPSFLSKELLLSNLPSNLDRTFESYNLLLLKKKPSSLKKRRSYYLKRR